MLMTISLISLLPTAAPQKPASGEGVEKWFSKHGPGLAAAVPPARILLDFKFSDLTRPME